MVSPGAACKLVPALLVLWLPANGQDKPVIREERSVVVDGQPEVWRLEWATPPRSVCEPEGDDWWTCPCSGFAFGESGKLDLVRLRLGREVECLPLAPLFENSETPAAAEGHAGDAVLRRWDIREGDWDYMQLEDGRSSAVPGVRSRPLAAAMNLADYDHDGQATEFLLQTSSSPCGHLYGVVVGVSRQVPHLHAFTTAAHPDRPLLMDVRAWKALLHSAGPARVVVWPCGDHAVDTETELEVSAASGAIRVTSREFQCDANDKRGKLISEKPLVSQLP